MLTARQQEVLKFIQQFDRTEGYPPTIREIGRALGIRSLRGVTVHLDALVRKGQLQRNRRARGLRLARRAAAPGAELSAGTALWSAGSVVALPLVGRIAAGQHPALNRAPVRPSGQPILAEALPEESMVVDRRLAPPGCFVVRVHGESMVGAGIHHGDYVIVRPQATAQNGEIVAVLIEGEATVKRFFRDRHLIRLQPENPAIKPLIFREADLAGRDIRVLGRVVGLMRKC